MMSMDVVLVGGADQKFKDIHRIGTMCDYKPPVSVTSWTQPRTGDL
jgi:hypothetical protein